MLTPKLACRSVCLNNWLRTTWGRAEACQLDHHPQTLLVGFVAGMSDTPVMRFSRTSSAIFPDQAGRSLTLVRQPGGQDRQKRSAPNLLNAGAGPHGDAAPPGQIRLAHAIQSHDEAGGGKVGRLDDV